LLSSGCELDFEGLPADLTGRSRLDPFKVVLAAQQGAMRLWAESSLTQGLSAWLTHTAALQRR
jgi:hypothetical protein